MFYIKRMITVNAPTSPFISSTAHLVVDSHGEPITFKLERNAKKAAKRFAYQGLSYDGFTEKFAVVSQNNQGWVIEQRKAV